jgi:hypothetical protein
MRDEDNVNGIREFFALLPFSVFAANFVFKLVL